jgi:hypothetical protein
MLKDYYPYEANAGLTSFKFTSMFKGRKINKVVNFTKLVSIGEHIYNLHLVIITKMNVNLKSLLYRIMVIEIKC